MLIILHADLFDISAAWRPPELTLGSMGSRDRQYVGRDNIKSIPYGSIYRATTVTDVTFVRIHLTLHSKIKVTTRRLSIRILMQYPHTQPTPVYVSAYSA